MPALAAPVLREAAGKVLCGYLLSHSDYSKEAQVYHILKTAYIPQVGFQETSTGDGSFELVGTGLKSFPDTDHVFIAVWQKEDQSDRKVHEATVREDGSCVATGDVSEHGRQFGTYQMALLSGEGEAQHTIAKGHGTLTADNYVYSVPVDANKDAVILRIVSPNLEGQAVNSVQAVVASEADGGQDKTRFDLEKVTDDVWETTVASTAFALDGRFHATVYTGDVDLGQAQFDMTRPAFGRGAKMIALTFDDGPGKDTGKILTQLKKYKGHATFFVTGKNAARYGNTLKAIKDAGCEIGNHSYNHPQLGNASAETIKKELGGTNDVIKKAVGTPALIVRPPYGDIGDPLRAHVQAPMILWSIDTLDWKTRDVKATVEAVMKSAQDGDIVLMHDIHAESVAAAVEMIPLLKKKGFELVTVSEMAAAKGEKMQNGVAYGSFKK